MSEPSTISRRNLLTTAGLAGAGLASMAAAPAVGGLADTVTSTAGAAIDDTLEALRLVKVFASTDEQHLLSDFDDTHVVHDDGGIEFLLWPGDLVRLQATGLAFELLETPLERSIAESLRFREEHAAFQGLRAPGETDGEYRTLDQFNADMRSLADTYPDKCRVIELPHRTLERRTVLGLEICDDVDREDGRPVYYNDGVHHAREFPAAEVPIMWAYDLLEADTLEDGDPNKSRLLTIRANVRNIVVPVVNPDGFNWAREALLDHPNGTLTIGLNLAGRQGYWRKNRRAYNGSHTGDPILTRESAPEDMNDFDAYGIDNNRNYGFGWGGDGSSPVQEALTYRGSEPFSEQETKNVVHVFEKYQCTGSISHHTSGDLILWAWGDTRDAAPDNDLLEGIGRAMATYNGYTPQKSIDLYVTTGTASDYMYGSRASISYTFEHAGSSFHPEYTATVPAMYLKNRESLMFLCEQVCLTPDLRPNYDDNAVLSPDARLKMAEQGLTLDRLNHGIVTGSIGTPGEVRLLKRYETQLWVQDYENGNTGADNPLGQPSVEEVTDAVYRTDDQGNFELHVNPSTQPKVEFLGREEAYTLVFTSDDGASAARRLVVKRGDVIDLGAVTLG